MKNNSVIELANLMNDSISGKVALFSSGADKYTDQAIREAFFEILGDDKLTWQNFANNQRAIYSVMEDVVGTNLPLAWENSNFYDSFVDVKNGRTGDQNAFVVEDNSILVASNFSGGHWQTERQKLQGKKEFSVTPNWIYIRVYDELDRFLKGTVTLAEMVTKIQKGFQNAIDEMVFASFNGIGTYLPAKFQETGAYDRATLNDLIQRVQVASQKNVILAGTRAALASVADGTATAWISNAAKDELATTGMVIENIGLPCKTLLIPQVFIRGSYDFKVDNNVLYVLPEGTKPVKLFYEGDVRAKNMTEQDTDDMTIDSQLQVRVGCGVICDNLIGQYTIV